MAPYTTLTPLPNELIHRIIEFTQPFEVENIMLVNKDIHAAIQNHNCCKKWTTHDDRGVPGGYRKPLEAFGLQVLAPTSLQEESMNYAREFSFAPKVSWGIND